MSTSIPQKRVITRNRELLACISCRRRKLKCDRAAPCATCVRRGDVTNCKYEKFTGGASNERQRRIQAEQKLEHLERLVQQLSTTPVEGHSNQNVFPTTALTGPSDRQSLNTGGTSASLDTKSENGSYTGSTHWSAMLEDIAELKSVMIPSDVTLDSESEEEPYDVLFGSTPAFTMEEVLNRFLPSRTDADRLTAAYLRSNSVAAPFIHSVQFGRQYQEFWNDPMTTPPLWVSIFFSMCMIAVEVLIIPKKPGIPSKQFAAAAAHCLVIGKYHRPKRYAVESLLLFLQGHCIVSLEFPPDLGLLFGTLIRLATKMGYHRDPESFNMSPFEKEMRRRTWSLCLQLDLLTSFELGLPSNIPYQTWDTQAPRSLFDTDFDENTTDLPPSRPDTEATHILFYIAKHRLMAEFEKILRHVLSPGNPSGPSVDELDAQIKHTYASLPQMLKPLPMTESVVTPSYLIVTRLCVYFIHAKCLCVLHRTYAARGRESSIRACYESASGLLEYFLDAYAEIQPGGQSESERWFLGSITWNDFLLASMVLCLVTCVGSQGVPGTYIDSATTVDLLMRAHSACKDQSGRSKDTERVKKLVEATLSRFGMQEIAFTSMSTSNGTASAIDETALSGGAFTYHGEDVMVEASAFGLESDWREDAARPVDDFSWEYLEQFSNLRDEDFVTYPKVRPSANGLNSSHILGKRWR